ncbi:unnamed protein product [Phytomonas sp. Hart1]|nr:unnamed protein product [Phytomonas sp. Hart1]|eukprot:CCW68211.1 unnamed protein product [Phytomonas sp. isolate Hart1]
MFDRKQEVTSGYERDSKEVVEGTDGAHAEGYAPESSVEQTHEHAIPNHTAANREESNNAVVAADHFDPTTEQVYYYQDEDGNYYCYTSPPVEPGNEICDSAPAYVAPENLSKYQEYINWKPRKYGLFIDLIVYTFTSILFKLYLTILLYSAGVLITLIGWNYTFSVLYHIYNPPFKDNETMQVICYLSIFFYLTFAIVNIICVLLDMFKNIWVLNFEDIQFWGMSHKSISKQGPPYLVYLTIFTATVIVPLIWSMIDAARNNNTVLYWLQCYAAVAVIVTIFVVLMCYAWFYWRSIVYKGSALQNYTNWDEFPHHKETYGYHPEKKRKAHWYNARTVLEEFGLDKASVRCDSFVFTVGCIPFFTICAVQALSTYTGDPSVRWGMIGSLALVGIYTLTWLSLFRRKNYLYVYTSLSLNFCFLGLGIVGGLSTTNPFLGAIVCLLWFLSQYMLIRRRTYALSDKELRKMLEIPLDYQLDETKQEAKMKSYFFSCIDIILDYISCLSENINFQHKHPDVHAAEESISVARVALRSDQKVLLLWWFFVLFGVAFVIGIGNEVRYIPDGNIALLASTAQAGTNPNSAICQIVYNRNGAVPLKVYDLALLSALSFTYSTFSDQDFATWFSHQKDFTRIHPQKFPPTLNYETDGTAIRYSVYEDKSSGFYVITLNSNSRGLSIFRDINDWGESIILRVAGAVTPLISLWPDSYKKSFVQNTKLFKDWLSHSKDLDNVKKAIEIFIQKGLKNNVLLVGEQFNGGYVKLLSDEYGIPFFVFNPPGVGYKLSSILNGTQMSAVRGLWSYVDSIEDSDAVIHYSCDNSHSSNYCIRITAVIDYIYKLCGDPYKRIIHNI